MSAVDDRKDVLQRRKEIHDISVITIIGSTKYEISKKNIAEYIQAAGYLSLMTSVGKKSSINIPEDVLMKEGYKRIDISDFVYCANIYGYIGDNTIREYHYATMVKRIPVHFVSNYITPKMLSGLNFYFEDKEGKPRISLSLFGNSIKQFEEIIEEIACVKIRKNPVISPDVFDLIEPLDVDFIPEMLKADIIINYIDSNPNIKIDMVDDDVFEAKIKESDIYGTEDENFEKMIETEYFK